MISNSPTTAGVRSIPRWLPLGLWLATMLIMQCAHTVTGSIEAMARLSPLHCPLHWLTGIRCPTCGLGRALMAAWIGQWHASFHFHPLGIPFFILSGLGVAALAIHPKSSQQLWQRLARLLSSHPKSVGSLVFLYTIWGVLRNL